MAKDAKSVFTSVFLSGASTAALLVLAPCLAHAQAAAPTELEEIVTTGSRFGGRIVTESPTPIDLVPASELARGGQVQLQQALKSIVPSFSVSQPATAGTLDFTSTPALRGLGPGELLLMVNGKRRHSTGVLNNNNQIGRGDVGYDFSSIPSAAIGHIEVLRDGASAQYGADAIAGVINLALDRSLGASFSAMTGGYTEGDGFVYDLQGSYGFDLGEGGVLRATVRYQDRNGTNRARPDTRQQYLGSNGTTTISGNYGSGTGLTASNGTLDSREATIDRNVYQLGDPSFKAPSIFLNADRPISDSVTLYGFGGYSHLHGRNPNFFRRAGQDETVRALHPNGFRPDGVVDMDNTSAAVGAKGEQLAGFNWDLSTEYGKSLVDLRYVDSNNPSMGLASPTEAYASGLRFEQWTTNFDITREIPVGDSDPLKFAAGAEFRKEWYTVVAGEPASYINGGALILDGPNAGRPAPVGFQPGPGLSPIDASKSQRNSKAFYAELEKKLMERLLVSGAVRYEDFSDFGDNTTYKFSGRYEVTQPFAVRASYSTGFRAPHLAQSYFSSTSTTFLNGNAVTLRLFPVNNPVARALGATDLKPEKSHNISFGGVFTDGPVTLSVDAYQIKLKDRMALSSTFQDTRITTFLAAQGFPGIGAVSYMTNAIDTRTRGVDITGRYRMDLDAWGELTTTFAGNINKTKVTRIRATPSQLTALGIVTPLFDLTQQVRLSSASPKNKFSLDFNWDFGDFSFGLKNTRYGEVSSVAFSTLTPARIDALTQGYKVKLAPTDPASTSSQVIQTFGAKFITDISLSYSFGDAVVTVGVNNVLDIYPDKNIASTVAGVAAGSNGSDNAGTFPYNYISPFGYNGRFAFAKLAYKF